jgi:ribose transport system substrate-binding protein
MSRSRNVRLALGAAVMLIAVLAFAVACATPGGVPAPPVVQTVVVERVQTAAPVVQTVVVQQTVAAPPEACATMKDNYKIGFANLTEDIVFTKLVGEGIESAAQAAGNIEIVRADNKLDGATALANADSFITQGVDGVIEFQTDEKFGNVIMDKFRAEGIPVIAIDIPMPGATFFGADNYRAGRLAGEEAAKYVNANWEGDVDAILLLELPQSGPIPAARMQGMLEGLQDNLTNKVPEDMIIRLDSKNTQDEAFKVVGDTLPRIPDAQHIVGMTINDGTALGTIAALEAANRQDQAIVVGQGADPSGQAEIMKEGSIYIGATGYFPEKYGEKIIPAMLDALNCKPLPPSIYVDHVLINKDNLCTLYPESEACKQ